MARQVNSNYQMFKRNLQRRFVDRYTKVYSIRSRTASTSSSSSRKFLNRLSTTGSRSASVSESDAVAERKNRFSTMTRSSANTWNSSIC